MEGCSGQLLPPAGQVRPATAAHGKGPLKSTESTVMGGRSSGDPSRCFWWGQRRQVIMHGLHVRKRSSTLVETENL